MSVILPMIAASIVGIALVLVLVLWKYRDSDYMRQDTDYRAFFWIGLVCMVFGGPVIWLTDNFSFTGLFTIGLVFFVMGLANKDKWGKRRKLGPKEMRTKLIAVVAGLVVLMAGVFAFMMFL